MDTAQHVFYIFGTIAFGLIAIFLLIITIVMIRIGAAINKMQRRFHFVARELRYLMESGRSYSRYVGASFMSPIMGMLLRFLRRRDE